MAHNSAPGAETTILRLNASGRVEGSQTRALCDDLVEALIKRHGRAKVIEREIAAGMPFVDDAWIDANFTAAEARDKSQRAALSQSDELVRELEAADILVVGAPVYNFTIPASLKAWIDMVARARRTFRYTEDGPEGLLKNKQAYLVVASGGVPIGSKADFATPYLRHILGFLGIHDVKVIAAGQLNQRRETVLDAARMRIAELVYTSAGLQTGSA